jgi:hypothetical protein
MFYLTSGLFITTPSEEMTLSIAANMYYGVLAQSKNCRGREIAVAR